MIAMKEIKIRVFIVMACMAIAPFGYAATQGQLSSPSIGTFDATIVVDEIISINGVDDIPLPQWTGSGDIEGWDDVCVFSNTTGGGYNVSVTAQSGYAFLALDSTSSPTLSYRVFWNDDPQTNIGEIELTYGQQLTGQLSGASTVDCSNLSANVSARVRILFDEASLMSVPWSIFNDTLLLTMAPE